MAVARADDQPPAPSNAASGAKSAGGLQSGPCLMVIFGASGDLTKRLLMPALYNLACDGLLPDEFAIVGIAMDDLTTESFRERMTRDIRTFNTRKEFDAGRLGSALSPASLHAGQLRRRGGVSASSATWSPELDAQYQAARQRPVLHGHAAVASSA